MEPLSPPALDPAEEPVAPAPGAASAPAAPRARELLISFLAVLPLSLVGAFSLLAAALATQLALVLVTLRWARRTGFAPWRLLRLSPPRPRALLLGAGVGVAGLLAGGGLHALTRAALPDRMVAAFDVGRALLDSGWGQLLLVVVVSLLPPLCEELAFRGGLQSALAGRRSPARAIGLSALAFAAFHLDPVRLPGVLLLGLGFGWLTWRTGSIWPAVLAHVVNNGAGVLGLLLVPRAERRAPADALALADAGAALASGLVLYALLATAARRWLPPSPDPAWFLVPGSTGGEGGGDRAATTAGAAPSP